MLLGTRSLVTMLTLVAGQTTLAQYYFSPLNPGCTTSTHAADVSNDAIVVGTSCSGGFRWSQGSGFAIIGNTPIGVSADGNTVISETARWTTASNAWTSPPANPQGAFAPRFRGVNRDGTIIVGSITNTCFSEAPRGLVWNTLTNSLSTLVNNCDCNYYYGYGAKARSVRSDGLFIGGGGAAYHITLMCGGGTIWDRVAGTASINSFVGWDSYVAGMSSDSLVLAGVNLNTNPSSIEGYRRSSGRIQSGQFTAIDNVLNVVASPVVPYVTGISDDGTRIVGGREFNTTTGNDRDVAWIWIDGVGKFNVQSFLEGHGLASQLAGWYITSVNGISRNGLWICGDGVAPNGQTLGWVAGLPASISSCNTSNHFVLADTTLGRRWQHALALDGQGKVIAFGGRDESNNFLDQTLKYENSTWTPINVTGPSPRADHAMAAQAFSSSGIYLFGGKTSSGTLLNDTWRFLNGQWTQLTPPGTNPSPRGGHAIVLDEVTGRLIMFGGFTDLASNPTQYSTQTWAFSGTRWSLTGGSGPSGRFAHAMAYDPNRRAVVLFGGHDSSGVLGDTWMLSSGVWTRIMGPGPSARFYHSLQYDPASNGLLLIGGLDANGPRSDQWLLTATGWQQLPNNFSGGPIWAHSAITTMSGEMLVSGGATTGLSNATWRGSYAPYLIEQPKSLSVSQGSTAIFSVTAVNGSNLLYQWQHDGQPLSNGGRVSGADTAILNISDAQPSDIGNYSVSIYNCSDSGVSQSATLGVVYCDSIDFNNDGSVFDPQDIDAFLSVYSEGPCIPEAATCNDIDFNNDGSVFDPRDIDAFLSVFSEGPCF